MSESEAPQQHSSGAGGLVVPQMPVPQPVELYSGPPALVVPYGHRHSIGWQDNKKTGPTFVVIRFGRLLDTIKILERFPLTEDGWARAWRALAEAG